MLTWDVATCSRTMLLCGTETAKDRFRYCRTFNPAKCLESHAMEHHKQDLSARTMHGTWKKVARQCKPISIPQQKIAHSMQAATSDSPPLVSASAQWILTVMKKNHWMDFIMKKQIRSSWTPQEPCKNMQKPSKLGDFSSSHLCHFQPRSHWDALWAQTWHGFQQPWDHVLECFLKLGTPWKMPWFIILFCSKRQNTGINTNKCGWIPILHRKNIPIVTIPISGWYRHQIHLCIPTYPIDPNTWASRKWKSGSTCPSMERQSV